MVMCESNILDAGGVRTLHGSPNLMQSYHQHDEVELNFVESGSMTYLLGGTKRTVPEKTLAVFWATYPHQVISVSPQPTFYYLSFPLAYLLRWNLNRHMVTALLNGDLVLDQNPENQWLDMSLFPRWHSDITAGTTGLSGILTLELEARIRRIVWNPNGSLNRDMVDASSEQLSPSSGDLTKLETITRFIAENYSQSIDAALIAEQVSLHPKYVMRLFRKNLNMTVGEYVTQHRMSHAQKLLATTDLKIVHIAFESGFGSVSQFYELFQKRFGKSPSQFKKEILSGIRKL